ncbi:MAG: protease HtpX [Nevskiaceae bacterium]|nr:MAG: protease HtpX [Nevskiaceae bacterium]TBR73125.1 MAG: protease HtpX [Nevskiaceae bacterium]
MKRILLFLLTNVAIMAVLGVLCWVLGVDRYLTANGLNLPMLLAFSAILGMGGAFMSLAMSKWMAKMSVGAKVIKQPANATESWLVSTVQRLANGAGIGMPEVAIYDAPEMNAFATGMTKNSSLVAVSSGLLQSMDRDEVEGVLGHEITHIANGDMVTLTLVQGVVNTFVFFLARVIGYAVDQLVFKRDSREGVGMGYFMTVMALQVVLGFAATMIVCAFSRWREFHADAGGAHLAGKRKMIAALQRLKGGHDAGGLPQNMTAMGITGGKLSQLFMTHPPLDDRIAALQKVG